MNFSSARARHRHLGRQPRPRLRRVLRGPDDLDDEIEVGERQGEPAQQVRALLRLLQVELGAPDDDDPAMVDEVPQEVVERQDARLVVDDRQEDDAERALHRGERVQLVEDDLGVLAALQLDDDPHALAVGLVAQVGDALDLLVVDELRDALDELRLVDLVRDLRDDDRFLVAARRLLHDRPGPDLHGAPPGLVRVADALGAVDEGAGGEVRAGEPLHELSEGRVRVLDQLDRRVDDLREVVRRDVRRHADRDAGRAVDEQVRELRRQHDRLDERAVVVGRPVDGLLVDVVAEQLRGQARQAHLGVAHRGGVVAVDRAEVALPVDQRITQREVLRHADDRVVDGALAVRVVLAEDVADDARRLAVRLVVQVALLPHAVEAAAVDGLQSVAHVREGPSDDDGHRVSRGTSAGPRPRS
jgi:hypothetical protein